MKQVEPIEYWISRATDPYVDESSRKSNISHLCDRVNSELEGAQVATAILSHKIVSPDQDEALFALQVVDQLVRRCGEKVHTRVGKFRFLNQLVKLITPKYLGTQTSTEVRNLAIELLYTWQKSMRHVEKFKEVYDTLKEHKVISQDPDVAEERIMIVPGPAPKVAEFEDEEKSRLLKDLLRSGKPEDLQAANRLIKSLVRNNEHKTEKEHTRRTDLERALKLCEHIQMCMVEKTAEAIGMSAENVPYDRITKAFDELMNLRPTLFRYAGEAAETTDPVLTEILHINDQVNKWIQKYRCFTDMQPRRPHNGGSQEECADLLGTCPPEVIEASQVLSPIVSTSSPSLPPSLVPLPSPAPDTCQDVPFIGFDRTMTPALPRRSCKKVMNEHSHLSLTSLIDGDLFATSSTAVSTFKVAKPTLNDLCSTTNAADSVFENIEKLSTEQSVAGFSADTVSHLSSTTSSLCVQDPVVILDTMNIRVLAYRMTAKQKSDKNCVFLMTLLSMNVEDVTNVRINVTTNSLNVQLKLDESELPLLPGLSPPSPISTAYMKLHVSPLMDISEVELDLSICFTLHYERTVTSSFVLSLR